MATTVLDLIKAALRVNGIIASSETPDPNTSQDCLQALNFMLQEWDTEGLALYHFEQQTFAIVANTPTYTIGSGGNWDGNRPLEIQSLVIRDTAGNDNNDYQAVQYNQSDFLAIGLKDTLARPNIFNYEQSFPLGKVHLYPTPEQSYSVIILSRAKLTEYSSLTTEISLPAGYLPALKWNLAINISPEFEATPTPYIIAQAKSTFTKIKRLNNLHRVPKMGYSPHQPGTNRQFDYRTGGF